MHEISDGEFRTAVERLRRLIRFDTANPPGDERAAAEFLARILEEAGIGHEMAGEHPERPNLVAKLPADSPGKRPLVLSCHLDVVPADPRDWTHPPFDGVEADGCVWGRGAIDMKGFAIMALTVLLRLRDRPRDRDVIFAAVADEEAGTRLGSKWLVEKRPDLLGDNPEYVINEVGGFTLHQHGKRFYPVQVAEKGIAWLKLRATGTPGHSSLPSGDNAIAKLGEAAARINRSRLPWHVSEPARIFFNAIARERGPLAEFVCDRLLLHPAIGPALLPLAIPKPRRATFEALLRNTAAPTIVSGGSKINVSPAHAALEIDGRLAPGQKAEDLIEELQRVVGEEFEFEILSEFPASVFSCDTPLFEKIRSVMKRRDPEGIVVPSIIPGFTDSQNYGRLGATCHGFYPLQLPENLEFASLFHGIDERIPVDGFRWGIDTLMEVVAGFVE